MYRIKYIFTVTLLALFVVASVYGSAIAHCDQAFSGGNATSMVMASEADSTIHNMASMADDGECNIDNARHHNPSDDSSNSSNCLNCYGSMCQTQSLVHATGVPSLFDSFLLSHSEKVIHFTTIFLTKIPDPPRELS